MDAFAQNLSTSVVDQPFPILSNFPAVDNINPGIGQIVDMHHVFVPIVGEPIHTIKKKIDNENDIVGDQSGAGDAKDSHNVTEEFAAKNKMDARIEESFNHPKIIKTESIKLPKLKAEKRKLPSEIKGASREVKKLKHSFNIQ